VNKARAELQAWLWLIGFALIVMKLAGLTDWSWWAVTAPIWVQMVFSFAYNFVSSFVRARLQRDGKGGSKVWPRS